MKLISNYYFIWLGSICDKFTNFSYFKKYFYSFGLDISKTLLKLQILEVQGTITLKCYLLEPILTQKLSCWIVEKVLILTITVLNSVKNLQNQRGRNYILYIPAAFNIW